MLIRSLEAHGVPSLVLDRWEKAYGDELLPIQEKAIGAGVLAGESMLVTAPTSAGKTFVGEMAAIHSALSGRKVLYLVPTKSLAEARYREFSARYVALGLNISIATRDRRRRERQIGRGEFDLLIAVPEKMRALLSESPGVSRALGTVVADELQMLGDPERGSCLELLLGDLVAENPSLQIAGLSAVLADTGQVADWLGATAVSDDRRPVELRRGVLDGSAYHYRRHSDDAEGVEQWPELARGPADPGERMAQVATHLAESEGSVLVFLRDRRTTLQMARAIAKTADLPAADDLVQELTELEQTRATRLLAELAASGVGFHNADLSFGERDVIERAFAHAELSVLTCTSTLAMGVNLPARNVIIDSCRWTGGESQGRPSLGAITRADFDNMAGRAGRLGWADEIGRAVLIADGEVRRHVLASTYLQGEFPRLKPRIAEQTPLQQICLLAGSATARRPDGITRAYHRTLSAHESGLPPDMLPSDLRDAVDLATSHGLLRETAEGGWRPTGIGRLCGTAGLTPRSFLRLLKAARSADGQCPDELEALLIAALTDEPQQIPLPPGGWSDAFDCDLDDPTGSMEDQWEAQRLLSTVGQLAAGSAAARRRERAVRIALAVNHWRGWRPTAEVENATRIPAGRLATLAEAVGWALQVLAKIGRELAWPRVQWEALMSLGDSTCAGVPEEGLALAGLHVPGLGRGQILRLLDAGITSRDALADGSPETLERLLGPKLAARALAVACDLPLKPGEDCSVMPQHSSRGGRVATPAGSAARRLIVEQSRPDRIILDDQPVSLRPAEFKLLRTLALQPQTCIDYEAIYQSMWGGETFVEPAQIYSHRSRLASKLEEVAPDGRELLRTIPTRGLMLDLPPEDVSLA